MSVLPRFASSNIAASVPTVYLGSGFSSSKISAIAIATSTGSGFQIVPSSLQVQALEYVFYVGTSIMFFMPYEFFAIPG